MCSSISSPSIGMKINITMAAEAQAKTGHDVFAFDSWTVQQYGESLTPMDDVQMQRLIAKSTASWATPMSISASLRDIGRWRCQSAGAQRHCRPAGASVC